MWSASHCPLSCARLSSTEHSSSSRRPRSRCSCSAAASAQANSRLLRSWAACKPTSSASKTPRCAVSCARSASRTASSPAWRSPSEQEAGLWAGGCTAAAEASAAEPADGGPRAAPCKQARSSAASPAQARSPAAASPAAAAAAEAPLAAPCPPRSPRQLRCSPGGARRKRNWSVGFMCQRFVSWITSPSTRAARSFRWRTLPLRYVPFELWSSNSKWLPVVQ
mmetsp:Transcript_56078/g.173792  ORF Transcript_56078/g.173792 Transcript_56078/m.173792 type:complete len:223 (+) Transcript_56078:841-1509(+)